MPPAIDDLRRLDGSVRVRVAAKLQEIGQNPEMGARLHGPLQKLRKVVVGDRTWRIVYEVTTGDDLVVVWAIGPRANDEVYEEATRRVRDLPRGSTKDRLDAILAALGKLQERDLALERRVQRSPTTSSRRERLRSKMGRRRRRS